jgi:transposase
MIRTREPLEVDRATLPTDGTFQRIGVERRQVFDIQISSVVTEYQAEILEDEHGRRVVAPFPKHVTVKAQYASGVKIHSVYMSNFQLLPLQADRRTLRRSVRHCVEYRQHRQLQQRSL